MKRFALGDRAARGAIITFHVHVSAREHHHRFAVKKVAETAAETAIVLTELANRVVHFFELPASVVTASEAILARMVVLIHLVVVLSCVLHLAEQRVRPTRLVGRVIEDDVRLLNFLEVCSTVVPK